MELKSMCDNQAATTQVQDDKFCCKFRPCDACGVKQARWFCAADDAHLCHLCDTSVHSANSVACRHERVKLARELNLDSRSSWSRKRSRSNRSLKQKQRERQEIEAENLDLELELGSLIGAGSHDEQENQLCGLVDTENMPSLEWLFDRVKVENLKIENPDGELFDLNINFCDLKAEMEEEDEVKVVNLDVDDVYEKKICLKLNYEDVLSAWCGRGSPWADQNTFHAFLDDSGSEAAAGLEYGVVPDLNAGACEESTEDVPVSVTHYNSSGGFREARVMRYREKRRNRLFSKRIRYHVRKLNAEQRPRMKGRFVKKEPELFSAHKHTR